MTLSPFSLDGGRTANRNALLEQMGLALALSRNRQDIAGGMLSALDSPRLLNWFWDPNSPYPSSCAYTQDGVLYIQVGGTNQEIQGNFSNVMGCLQSSAVGSTGTVINSWFRECVNVVGLRLQNSLPSGWQTMPKRWIGHSQGAAVAFGLGVSWASQFPAGAWDWFGFAAPRCYGGTPLATNLLPRWGFVVINQLDPVPRLPPNDAIYALRVSPVSPLTWGTTTAWRHYGRILQIQTQGIPRYLDPGPDEDALTSEMLASTLDYHMSPQYGQMVQLLWRAQGG